MWYIHTMEYYLAVKRNEVLIHGWILDGMRMNLKNGSEESQMQYSTYYTIPFIEDIQKRGSIEIEGRLMVTRGRRERLPHRDMVFLWGDDIV